MHDDEAARDATQEALISIARHIGSFDGRSRYTTWSYRIAANAALDEARRSRRRPVVPIEEEGRTDRAHAPDFAPGLVLRFGVEEALRRLPSEQEEVIRLRYGLGLDYAEIADHLRIPIGTVRSRLARGRLALARILQPQAEGNPSPTAHVQGGEER